MITRDVSDDEAARRRTRIRATVAGIAGWPETGERTLLSAVATALTFAGTTVGGPGSGGGAEALSSGSAALGLEAADGIVAGVSAAGTLVMLLMLVMWAISIAGDHQTGAIRILLVTEARRMTFLAGKLASLMLLTVATVVLAVGCSVAVAEVFAALQGMSTAAWDWAAVASAVVDLGISSLLWGTIGAAAAMAFRSSAAAIACGAGYFLLGERLIELAWDGAGEWLPGGVATSVMEGGSATLPYPTATVLAIAWLCAGVVGCMAVLRRRDITD